MKAFPTWQKFIYSRKFWVFVTAFVTLFFSCYEDGSIQVEEVKQLVLLTIGYLGSVALEDGLSNLNPPKEKE